MKRPLLLILVFVGVLGRGNCVEASTNSSQYTTSINNGQITITAYQGEGGDVVIPSTINELPVTSINEKAFMGKDDISSIRIPEGVRSIQKEAFFRCRGLTNVSVPSSASLIGTRAFDACFLLKAIEVAPHNSTYCSVDGVLFNKKKSVLIQYAVGKPDQTYSVPTTVTTIGPFAFRRSHLTHVTIPKGVSDIGDFAFAGCTLLTEVSIPPSVTKIGRRAFQFCDDLKQVVFEGDSIDISSDIFVHTPSDLKIILKDGKTWTPAPGKDITSIFEKELTPDQISHLYFALETNNGKITIAKYTGPHDIEDRIINVPPSIDGLPVTSIGTNAFAHCEHLVTLVIPQGVTNVSSGAFAESKKLVRILLPDGITTIGNSAFFDCENLREMMIPDSVTNFGAGEFAECGSLTKVTLPKALISIPSETFSRCEGLVNVKIPANVIKIGENSFKFCSGLTNVNLSDNITSVGDGAFFGSGLCSVTIPQNITTIEPGVFGSSRLTDVTIPANVTNIGSKAFYCCGDLTNVTMPEGIASIGRQAFINCSKLTSVTVFIGKSPDGNHPINMLSMVTNSIEEEAFEGCGALKNLSIPSGIVSFGNRILEGCTNLAAISVSKENPNFSSLDGVLFNKTVTELIKYPQSKPGSMYSIPSSVTSIGALAFEKCNNLTSLQIGNTVTNIGNQAFAGCKFIVPATISPPVVEAFKILFAQGLPDPRDCSYREISVLVGSCWFGNQLVKTRGWVLHRKDAEKLAICWNGLVYPVKSVGAKAHLNADVAGALKNLADIHNGNGKIFPRSLVIPQNLQIDPQRAMPISSALLYRLGKRDLANKIWSASFTTGAFTESGYPYLTIANIWAWDLFDRAVTTHMNGEDRLSMESSRLLSQIQPLIDSKAKEENVPPPFMYRGNSQPPPFLVFLDQLPQLLRDEERRCQEAPYVPVLQTIPPPQGTDRINGLIRDLENVSEHQMSQPGGVMLSGSPIIQALIAEGDAAVEPLIKCLESDQRLTRSVGFGRDFWPDRHLFTVRDAAFVALKGILHTDFSEIEQSNLSALVAGIKAFWDKNKGTTPQSNANLQKPHPAPSVSPTP